MKHYYESSRISKVLECNTLSQMRRGLYKLLKDTADINILETDDGDDCYCITIFGERGLNNNLNVFRNKEDTENGSKETTV